MRLEDGTGWTTTTSKKDINKVVVTPIRCCVNIMSDTDSIHSDDSSFTRACKKAKHDKAHADLLAKAEAAGTTPQGIVDALAEQVAKLRAT